MLGTFLSDIVLQVLSFVAENERMSPPPMFPDYQGVTIPYNIAPLNFRIDVPAEKCYAKIEGSEQGVFEYYGTNTICFKSKDWERLTRANKGKAFFVTITTKEGDEWTKWAPFSVYISGILWVFISGIWSRLTNSRLSVTI